MDNEYRKMKPETESSGLEYFNRLVNFDDHVRPKTNFNAPPRLDLNSRDTWWDHRTRRRLTYRIEFVRIIPNVTVFDFDVFEKGGPQTKVSSSIP